MTDPNVTSPMILFVDDEATAVKYFQRAIGSLAPVATAGSVEEGKRMLDEHAETLTVLVSDQRMPGEYGNELLHYAKEHYPHMVRILTTAYSELEHTVEAVNQGQIYRYIQKPWDITALRMELKQALEFANLRKEHNQLLREKLMIRQKQTVANRIGTVHMICASVGGLASLAAVEAYLSAASIVGVTPPEPNWLLMDYSDLVGAEALRSGAFGHLVHIRLAGINHQFPGHPGAGAMSVLTTILGDGVQPKDTGTLVFQDGHRFTEFLEAPSGQPVSEQHASWLAGLIWLAGYGATLQVSRVDNALQASLAKAEVHASPDRLAVWVEQF